MQGAPWPTLLLQHVHVIPKQRSLEGSESISIKMYPTVRRLFSISRCRLLLLEHREQSLSGFRCFCACVCVFLLIWSTVGFCLWCSLAGVNIHHYAAMMQRRNKMCYVLIMQIHSSIWCAALQFRSSSSTTVYLTLVIRFLFSDLWLWLLVWTSTQVH